MFFKKFEILPKFFQDEFCFKELMEFFKSILKLQPCTSKKKPPNIGIFFIITYFHSTSISLFTFLTLKVLSLCASFVFTRQHKNCLLHLLLLWFFLKCIVYSIVYVFKVSFLLFCAFLMPQWICLFIRFAHRL